MHAAQRGLASLSDGDSGSWMETLPGDAARLQLQPHSALPYPLPTPTGLHRSGAETQVTEARRAAQSLQLAVISW